MQKFTAASSDQLTLGGLGAGSVVKLDGGKRLRLDALVDYWPATGRWRSVAGLQEGDGVTSLLAFITQARKAAGHVVPEPTPLASRHRVVCHYCNQPAQLHSGKDVHPNNLAVEECKFWVCWPCNAWVGCHGDDGGDRPMGFLADEALRAARKSAHDAFDRIWQSGHMTRGAAYSWLSKAMGIHIDRCHIAMMGVDQCATVKRLVGQREDSV